MSQSMDDVTELSDQGDDSDDFELEGSLKTTLLWDASSKQLNICLKQFLQTGKQMEIKYKGLLNTVTGEHRMRGQLLKRFQTNTLSLQKVYMASRLQNVKQRVLAEGSVSKNKDLMQEISKQQTTLNIDPDAFLPAGLRPLLLTDWCVSPGVTFDSERNGGLKLRPALLLQKAPQLLIHSPRTDLTLSGKALINFEQGTQNVSVGSGLRLKLYKFNVTSKQDLRVSVGLDLYTSPLTTGTAGAGKSWSRSPYVKVSENNTSVKFALGRWLFQYAI